MGAGEIRRTACNTAAVRLHLASGHSALQQVRNTQYASTAINGYKLSLVCLTTTSSTATCVTKYRPILRREHSTTVLRPLGYITFPLEMRASISFMVPWAQPI